LGLPIRFQRVSRSRLALSCLLLSAMKKKHDFRNAKRGAVIPQKGKSRITTCVDDLDEY